MSNDFDRLREALADRYVLECELGSGGMATVYLARDIRHNRNVAVKVLQPELAAIVGADRFLKEIEVTANLQHPHILPLFDSGEADSFLYYVMPSVEGESLGDRLERERQLSIEESLKIAEAVAGALDYAHRHGVIHRDIKPANILLHDGQPVVADFGIALAVSSAGGRRLTETGLSVGTPEYVSPEQATGEEAIDARSDVYSLGCVVYEMLVGEPPHTGPTAQAVIAKVITDEPPRVTASRRTVRPNVEYAVHRALSKLPADRFATAAEFAEALADPNAARAWPGLMATAEGDRWTRFAVANPWLRWVLPLGLAALAAAAAWGWLRSTPQPTAEAARFEIPYQTGETWWANRHALALSHDGSHLAFVSRGSTGGQLYLRPMAEVDPRAVASSEGALDPFFSPDGEWVGYATVVDINRVPVQGGPPVQIVEYPEPRGAAWSTDDIIFFGSTSGLWRVPIAGGAPEKITELDMERGETLHSRPVLLPGERGLLFTAGSGNADEMDVAALSLETGRVTRLFRGLNPRWSETGHIVYGRSDGALMAVPFDPTELQTTGQPVHMLDGIVVKTTATADFAISRNGSLAYLTGGAGGRTLISVDLQGREEPLVPDPGPYSSPRFSPDGTRLAISVGTPPARQIWTYEITDGTLNPLTLDGNHYYPMWTPDGEYVVFASETSSSVDLAWTKADGSGAVENLLANGRWNYPESWSPDRQHLVFREQDEAGRHDIWVLPLAGDRAPWRFLELPSLEQAPAVSVDGRWLAYASDLSGQYEIYVNGFPVPGARHRVSLEGGTGPLWSRDGTELFYWSDDGMMAARIETTPDFRVRSREVMFDNSNFAVWPYHALYDVHPDGRGFVMVKQAGAASARLVVVLNWFEELRLGTEAEP